ncbi:aminotransferase class III-fold pyridoxal phosphate-dependent enzyme [Streptomyces sp. NPDC047071]|uniref:aspartate aminotransferase family protein n=1 Tax=Streptomyces sp. NPDC047071 TaxID=3154808 RepID=UPI003453C40D
MSSDESAPTSSPDIPSTLRAHRAALSPEPLTHLYRTRLSSGRAMLGELFGGHVEVASQGAWVTTSSGRRFLNCGGYGVFLTGARHPTVMRYVTEQLHTHPVATRLFLEPHAALAADALVSVAPAGMERVHFAGSGTEAVEAAIKMARLNGKTQLIAMENGYHGKTMGALSLTGRSVFQDPFRPLLPAVTHVPYADAPALERALAAAGEGQACVFVEPVQGEAGVIIPPAGYLSAVEELCRRYHAFLVFDEIQTGLGRLGEWWGADTEVVRPDALLVGKVLSGAVVPVSAVVATPEAFAPLDRDPYLHTSTFSGAPLAMAAARGAIAAIKEDDLVERACTIGAGLLAELRRIVSGHFGSAVAEVRGRGLLLGIEFTDPALVGDLLVELTAHGVIANHSLNSQTVLRLTPPAVLTQDDLDFLYTSMDRACRALAHRYNPRPEGNPSYA